MSASATRASARLARYGILPAEGFAWKFVLVLAAHAGLIYFLVTELRQEVVVLAGTPGGGGAPEDEEWAEVNWMDPALLAHAESVARVPAPSAPPLEEPVSDIPLPKESSGPPPPDPSKSVTLKPVPKPEPPKSVTLKPVPKPEPPKSVTLKPVPKPEPPKSVTLKPVPKPEPPKSVTPPPPPKTVPVPVPVPVRAVPLPAPVVAKKLSGVGATPAGSLGTGTSSAAFPGAGSGPGGMGGPMSDISAFHLKVKDAYFAQWQQPRGLVESGSKFRVRTEIVIDRQGKVLSARVVTRSGQADMDRSVQEAVSRVTEVVPLPEGIGGATYTVLLNFDI